MVLPYYAKNLFAVLTFMSVVFNLGLLLLVTEALLLSWPHLCLASVL